MIGRTNAVSLAGGGTALNYSVVGGTTQPASPEANMIWVNTATEITSHVFSVTEPNSPEAGMVWFQTGDSSHVAFSATADNVIMVYPLTAKQYVSNAWTDVAAKSYLSGSWVTWVTWYFEAGSGVTADWKGHNQTNAQTNVSASYMTLKSESYTPNACAINSDSAYDLTNISRLYFDSESTNAAQVRFYGVSSTKPSDASVTFAAKVKPASAGRGISELDVSGLTGSYYIVLQSDGGSNKGGLDTVYNIYGA